MTDLPLPVLLIVEDDEGLQRQLKWAYDGYTVVSATDRRSAVEALRLHEPAVVTLDLGLPPAEPPAYLYHGTVGHALDAIRADGLRPMNRHHVHLSPDRETAVRVGARRGTPVVLAVDAGTMHRAGHLFHVSANGVWLTDSVPPEFLRLRE